VPTHLLLIIFFLFHIPPFRDPFETEFGWTEPGHYLTGCSADWINMVLAADWATTPVEDVVTCEEPYEMICKYAESAPVQDGSLEDWEAVEGIVTQIQSIFGITYDSKATYKCVHDNEKVYFALEIPGQYRFNSAEDAECAAIATMMKMGPKAGYLNMGGCQAAMEIVGDCAIPPECEDYKADLGAHWELVTTTMGVEYPMDTTSGSGADAVANKDDKYAVAPFCRIADDDANAGNEWAGAWSHSNPVEGEDGVYRFEIARTLKTASTVTDAQMEVGGSYKFGIAYWDPFETEAGWTAAGHFTTGCSADWIDLTIEAGGNKSGALAHMAVSKFMIMTASLLVALAL
jgi:hypothetical protein